MQGERVRTIPAVWKRAGIVRARIGESRSPALDRRCRAALPWFFMSLPKSPAPPAGIIRQLRDRIARVIEAYSANDVPALCRRYGLATGERDEAFAGKFKYASKRLLELQSDAVVTIAERVAQDEGDEELLRLLSTINPEPPAATDGLQPAKRTYYAERNGKAPAGGRLDLRAVASLFNSEHQRWTEAGYFVEHFGFWCVDDDNIHGKLGGDIEARMLFSLGKTGLWPVSQRWSSYSEEDLFSVIEFMFDHVSKPLTGTMHQYGGCGMHWETFDTKAGQREYRATMNVLLGRYGEGYEISPDGEVMERAPTGTANLLTTALPHEDGNVQSRVQSAINKFRQRHATSNDRRDAVRDLADVLEYLRPQARSVLRRKDEGALFQIANEFGIRHHNPAQKIDYDQAIWLSWMFYFYLATIHAVVRMIEKIDAGREQAE